MMLCMPVMADGGLEVGLSAHFGSSPYFMLVDMPSGRRMTLPNGHAENDHGRCGPARSLEGRRIDVVVCRGLGRRALQRLKEAGMDVLVTQASTAAGALEEFRRAELSPLTEREVCHGGGHGRGRRLEGCR